MCGSTTHMGDLSTYIFDPYLYVLILLYPFAWLTPYEICILLFDIYGIQYIERFIIKCLNGVSINWKSPHCFIFIYLVCVFVCICTHIHIWKWKSKLPWLSFFWREAHHFGDNYSLAWNLASRVAGHPHLGPIHVYASQLWAYKLKLQGCYSDLEACLPNPLPTDSHSQSSVDSFKEHKPNLHLLNIYFHM